MKYTTLIITCSICALSGAFWLAYQHQWIIIQVPPTLTFISTAHAQEQSIILTYWHDEQWHTETQKLLCTGTAAQTIQTVATSWLTLMHDEGIFKKKIILQSVLIDTHGAIAYLSFDRSPFDKEWSAYEKWMCIEGLVTTLRNANCALNSFYFLVRHQPLIDPHIDFSHPWPCSGFAR